MQHLKTLTGEASLTQGARGRMRGKVEGNGDGKGEVEEVPGKEIAMVGGR